MDIQLNFINNSNDTNNSQVVIFQKNVATDFDEPAVAWKVIDISGRGDQHPFVFSAETAVGSSDSYGNITMHLNAGNGQVFQVVDSASGNSLVPAPAQGAQNEIAVHNKLAKGAITANIYRSGRLLATKTGVAPQQKAAFSFKPAIWVGVVQQVEEGQVMNSDIMSSINTEISLLGIASADIVMTGGGPGAGSQPFSFNLQNIVQG
jgi:hypothetical protein